MTNATTTLFVCDRCSREVTQTTDLKAAQQSLPMGWMSTYRPNGVSVDLCRQCRDALDAFLSPFGSSAPNVPGHIDENDVDAEIPF